MKKFLITVCILGFGTYKGVEWLKSDDYLKFILKYKGKSWSTQLLLKTARYYIFADEWPSAAVFLDHCLSEDFEKRPERLDCIYERARVYDKANNRVEALKLYETFLKENPDHPKAELARKKVHMLRYGH